MQRLGGLILNCRQVPRELEKVQELAQDIGADLTGILPRSQTVQDAEAMGKTVLEAFPDSEMAACYRRLAQTILQRCEVAP